jgi:Helix-turn-helix domain
MHTHSVDIAVEPVGRIGSASPQTPISTGMEGSSDAVSRILGDQLLFSVNETAKVLRRSRNWIYVEMRKKHLNFIPANKRRRVTRAEIERHLRQGSF